MPHRGTRERRIDLYEILISARGNSYGSQMARPIRFLVDGAYSSQGPAPRPAGEAMLDVILDCFGVVALLGQAILFLIFGEIETKSA